MRSPAQASRRSVAGVRTGAQMFARIQSARFARRHQRNRACRRYRPREETRGRSSPGLERSRCMSLDFLLEIGTEEIPHWMIPGALDQLRKMNFYGAIDSVDATPRRLVVRASGIPERQADAEDLVSGPPKSGGSGAAQGFAKKM